MTARNDITGDLIVSGGSSDAYRDGWDRIFGKGSFKRIEESLASENIQVPPGLSREEIQEFIIEKGKEYADKIRDSQQSNG